jgi:DNA-binding NarL/FixJ family response regulator
MSDTRIKIALVDDHHILREGLRLLLGKQPDLQLVGEAADAKSALECLQACSPDLVVIDILLPGKSGITVVREIHARFPKIRTIILSCLSDPSYAHCALEAGASGYVLKENTSQELLRAIRAVMGGKLYLCPGITTTWLHRSRAVARMGRPLSALTEREWHLLRLIATGRRNKEIAAEFNMNVDAIEAWRSRLARKLDCHSTAELIRYAVREGVVAL